MSTGHEGNPRSRFTCSMHQNISCSGTTAGEGVVFISYLWTFRRNLVGIKMVLELIGHWSDTVELFLWICSLSHSVKRGAGSNALCSFKIGTVFLHTLLDMNLHLCIYSIFIQIYSPLLIFMLQNVNSLGHASRWVNGKSNNYVIDTAF